MAENAAAAIRFDRVRAFQAVAKADPQAIAREGLDLNDADHGAIPIQRSQGRDRKAARRIPENRFLTGAARIELLAPRYYFEPAAW